MELPRSSGILLHPTSLPSPDGIGDLGPETFRWLDFLADCGSQMWQILPLGPTGYADSPYQCFSAFAGNPNLISPTVLLDENLLKLEDLSDRPIFSNENIDFGQTITWKNKILDRAFERFGKSKNKLFNTQFQQFIDKNHNWLDDFALFMAIKEQYNNVSWEFWPDALRRRETRALDVFKVSHQALINKHMFKQYLFFKQWAQVKSYAEKLNIKIIGDLPIFIAYDSSDAWANPNLFHLDSKLMPTVVAGVPPDYFSRTGQLWGNPLYRWNIHQASGYQWWIERVSAVLSMVDIIRFDHFRGFEAYWEIPFGNPTAEIGKWVKGPGKELFLYLKNALGELPIIAEDLGLITDEVVKLRDEFSLPGMKILQFAFADDADDDFLPHNYPVNCFAYTGTHDNNTSRGWYLTASEREKDFCRRYLSVSGEDISWSLIRSLWQSIAKYVLAPMQDFLSLDGNARMNLPGSPSGNWNWRMHPYALNNDLVKRIYEMNYLYGRLPYKERKRLHVEAELAQTNEIKPH